MGRKIFQLLLPRHIHRTDQTEDGYQLQRRHLRLIRQDAEWLIVIIRDPLVIIVDDARHDILLSVGDPENIRPADHIPRLHGRAQKIHILPDLVQDDRHTKQEFITVIEPISAVKGLHDHFAVELHRLRMHRFIVIVGRDRARQLQILRAHVPDHSSSAPHRRAMPSARRSSPS